jgi:hypothetical protein
LEDFRGLFNAKVTRAWFTKLNAGSANGGVWVKDVPPSARRKFPAAGPLLVVEPRVSELQLNL